MNKRCRVAVLISGRGSNMQALIAAARTPGFPAEVVLVISNRPGAAGLAHAAAAGVATAVVDHTRFSDRHTFEQALTKRLEAAQVEFICHAGFMRIVTPTYVDHWRDRVLNIHPALLPSFPGLRTHELAIEAGVRLHGCTVHFVRAEVDSGPIVGQAAVRVLASDTPAVLADRVLAVEHQLYPHCLRLVAGGGARVVGERVVLTEPSADTVRPLFSPAL